MTDDATLLARVRELWERVDPAPADLADRVLFALELEDLDTEFELLRLVEHADASAGARASRPSDVTSITFSGPSLTVMLSVGASGDRRRVDGWLAPAGPSRVVAHSAEGEHETAADETGRFVLEGVPSGMLRLVVHPEPGADGAGAPFLTPTVEI
jgi:hypothetical protein